MASGVPVVIFSKGGGREIIEDGVTGVWFERQTEADLTEAVKKCRKIKFDIKILKRRADLFSKERFKKEFLEILAR